MTHKDAISHCYAVAEKSQARSDCAEKRAQPTKWLEEFDRYKHESADAIEIRHMFDRVRT